MSTDAYCHIVSLFSVTSPAARTPRRTVWFTKRRQNYHSVSASSRRRKYYKAFSRQHGFRLSSLYPGASSLLSIHRVGAVRCLLGIARSTFLSPLQQRRPLRPRCPSVKTRHFANSSLKLYATRTISWETTMASSNARDGIAQCMVNANGSHPIYKSMPTQDHVLRTASRGPFPLQSLHLITTPPYTRFNHFVCLLIYAFLRSKRHLSKSALRPRGYRTLSWFTKAARRTLQPVLSTYATPRLQKHSEAIFYY